MTVVTGTAQASPAAEVGAQDAPHSSRVLNSGPPGRRGDRPSQTTKGQTTARTKRRFKPLCSCSQPELVGRARAGERRATAQLFSECEPIIASEVRRRTRHLDARPERRQTSGTGQGDPREDLYQEGRAGLMKALHNYDPDKARGTFKSYAAPYISNHVKVAAVRMEHAETVSERLIADIGLLLESERSTARAPEQPLYPPKQPNSQQPQRPEQGPYRHHQEHHQIVPGGSDRFGILRTVTAEAGLPDEGAHPSRTGKPGRAAQCNKADYERGGARPSLTTSTKFMGPKRSKRLARLRSVFRAKPALSLDDSSPGRLTLTAYEGGQDGAGTTDCQEPLRDRLAGRIGEEPGERYDPGNLYEPDAEGHDESLALVPARAVHEAVAGLEPEPRLAVAMRYGLGAGGCATYTRIAGALGVSSSKARKLVRRAESELTVTLAAGIFESQAGPGGARPQAGARGGNVPEPAASPLSGA